jgi:hypothetical protein
MQEQQRMRQASRWKLVQLVKTLALVQKLVQKCLEQRGEDPSLDRPQTWRRLQAVVTVEAKHVLAEQGRQ